MSSELQLDVRHHIQWRRHLVNAYEEQAGMVYLAGKTVWSMSERFETKRCIKTLYKYSSFLFFSYIYIYEDDYIVFSIWQRVFF